MVLELAIDVLSCIAGVFVAELVRRGYRHVRARRWEAEQARRMRADASPYRSSSRPPLEARLDELDARLELLDRLAPRVPGDGRRTKS